MSIEHFYEIFSGGSGSRPFRYNYIRAYQVNKFAEILPILNCQLANMSIVVVVNSLTNNKVEMLMSTVRPKGAR